MLMLGIENLSIKIDILSFKMDIIKFGLRHVFGSLMGRNELGFFFLVA